VLFRSVFFDNKPVHATKTHTYIALNKPVGYLCSRRSQGGVPTIFELLPEKYRPLKPVGRLDKDSSGLILLTDDGDFAHRMTHPSFHKVKSYEVALDKPLEPLHQQMISDHGVSLEDGVSQLMIERIDSETHTSFSEDSAFPAERGDTKSQREPSESEEKAGERGATQKPHDGSGQNRYQVTMHEGRNRQIRRTFAALGYTVVRLHRTTFGNYSLGDIKTGEHVLVDIR
jgi:pseudouridine synthase